MSDAAASPAPKLLIVDDSRVSRMMIRAFFAKRQPGWTLLEAQTGDEALAQVAAERPDFVTLDVNMPGINGFEAAEKILALN
ncbi:response regulator, partial [Acinetobacter baumannii]